jgi:hypothetical protein
LQWIRSARDELRLLCDETCKSAADAADLASEYWLEAGSWEKTRFYETKLLGAQEKLRKFVEMISQSFGRSDVELLDDRVVDFFDCLTGGRYGEQTRPADIERARFVQVQAAEIVLLARTSFKHAVSASATMGTLLARIDRSTRIYPREILTRIFQID